MLAFAPVVAVDYLLDNYVRVRERAVIQQRVDTFAERISDSANAAVGSLRRILSQSPSLCTPTFLSNVHAEMGASLSLRQVLVENSDGVQFCDALGREVDYVALSQDLGLPRQTERLAVVQMNGLDMPVLKVTQGFGNNRTVAAFVPVLANPLEGLALGMPPASVLRIALTDGTDIVTVGDPTGYDQRSGTEYISASAFVGELPIRVDAAMPFALVRADYADLDLSFTLIACVMSGAFLFLALQYVRRSAIPAVDLERAIVAGELKPYYQPVINLRTGELAGCEVLCRWEKRSGEVVPPGAFIDYAEVTGLAIPMTLSLMQQVRTDLSDLCTEVPGLKISINLFEGHFRDSTIVEDVQAIFGGSPINYRQLVFEITERRPLGNSLQANSVISGLHALGARLAMDDAGTGHSNLAYIETLGVDVIKIDRVFVDMIKPGATQVPILDGLIAMARDLGTEIVAEGVETEAQALYLRARGVVMAQGYLFAPALKVNSFRELARALHARHGQNVAPVGQGVPDAA
ncbi:EAL domain-containing protein [Arsenicitalea aurantiaca]|uniref:EAL domain-containing protein n=1 Tax=Arsenicitalea aurantiaca TaxID=1783274 RepID=A0A433XFJ9_9HYPH|nr:EAL domain-containing protein [Arsenicitalea aurantiaca]RUT32830.1 EAL domain-containing protein [Arsenicitalea aurantiaca]